VRAQAEEPEEAAYEDVLKMQVSPGPGVPAPARPASARGWRALLANGLLAFEGRRGLLPTAGCCQHAEHRKGRESLP